MRRRYLKSSQINSISPNNPSLSQAKAQAQAVGAVPAAATGGIISTLSEIGAALIKYPVTMYLGLAITIVTVGIEDASHLVLFDLSVVYLLLK